MVPVKVIDADSHIYEVDETWDYLPKEYRARRPLAMTVKPEEAPYLGVDNTFWLIDGRAINWAWGKGAIQLGGPLTSEQAKRRGFSVGSQSLLDVDARIRDLDNAQVDIQVIYPSTLLAQLSDDDAFETALIQSYNTYVSSRCAERPDRLKWAAVLPMRQPDAAVREIQRAKEAGAVALYTLGTVGDKLLHAPEFDPVWGAASESGLPVCVHVGWSYPPLRQTCDDLTSSLNLSFTLPLFMGFFSFVSGGIFDRFPTLRVGFLEAGADWLPWFVHRMNHYYPVVNHFRQSFGLDPLAVHPPSEYLSRVYVTCEADEPLLREVVRYLGENNIMVSEDMPHGELREGSVKELEKRTDISDGLKRKILSDNPARFYNLD